MKTYIGTKIIKAEPCKAWKEMGKHHIGEEGYKMVYPDGYISWLPKDVFEEAYKEVNNTFDFGTAIQAIKKGKRCARKGWNGKEQHIELAKYISYVNTNNKIVNVNHLNIGHSAIAFVGTSGVQIGWLASQADMLADDWYIVE